MKTFVRIFLGIGLISVGIGIGLLILAFGTGGSLRSMPTYSFEESYDEVKALDIQIGLGEVNLVEGEQFHVKAERVYKDHEISTSVVDGVWVIKEKVSNRLNLFGLKVPVVSFFGENFAPEITITVPKGFISEKTRLELGAGSLEADVIRTKVGSFEVGAGELKVKQLIVTGTSDYTVGAGYMKLDQVEVKDIIVNCGVGNIEIEGVVTGDNKIDCGIGRVVMDLRGDSGDYSYDIDSGIGNVIINGRNYRRSEVRRNTREETEGSFTIDNGIGNITLDIR